MDVVYVLLATLFVAVPVTAKYVTSFEVRTLLDNLRRRERELERLGARLDAVEREQEVVERAVWQVYEQRRWSATRRDLMAEELERTRRRVAPRRTARLAADDEPFVPDAPPVWEAVAQAAA